jgi:hypothetical protein
MNSGITLWAFALDMAQGAIVELRLLDSNTVSNDTKKSTKRDLRDRPQPLGMNRNFIGLNDE